ncbi:histidine kinase [Motiliproteus coralliicola]|uniref:histidine kinase n=1 Tax=Motiliproteus coralliicola TaxID=2283196 RepID=A0A369W8D1_9GAMM|nr:ATP-binding protein [Motiliproteus coralliicola]RDE18172.1 histidine kinase [Motiliproteus coralliicola]
MEPTPKRLPIQKLLWRSYVGSTLIPLVFVEILFLLAYFGATDQLSSRYTQALEQQAAFHQLSLSRIQAKEINEALDQLLPSQLKQAYNPIAISELLERLKQRNVFQLSNNKHYQIYIESEGNIYRTDSLRILKSTENPFLTQLGEIERKPEGYASLDEEKIQLLTWTPIPVTDWQLLTLSSSSTPAHLLQEGSDGIHSILMMSIAVLSLVCLLVLVITHRKSRSLSKRLTNPLNQLNQMISHIGAGSYEPERPKIDIEEIDRSAVGLSQMGQDLGEARGELQRINTELEQRVEERTQRLVQANNQLKQDKEQLEDLYEQLKQAQMQLIESEKMASIGQLAAGVAHEINNPMTYIIANIVAMQEYCTDLLKLIEQQQQLIEDSRQADNQALLEELDFAFIRDDIPVLIQQSLDGADRVKQIVQGLRDFSHTGQQEWERSDLREGLDSTLKVANNEIKHKAEVVREYQDIPTIDCLPSQLNQVFLNLLVNAAHAIPEQGTITVRTLREDDDHVRIEISDNGKGIAPENLSNIFEPFFTTKAVGEGTGLGLALSYSIIKSHNGKILVDSTPGKGTTFSLRLPIEQHEAPQTQELGKSLKQQS